MIGKILEDAFKTTDNALRTTGDVVGSVINARGSFMDRASDIVRIGKKKIKGKVIMMRSNVLDFTQLHSIVLDGFTELLGSGIVLQLVSATEVDSHCKFFFLINLLLLLLLLRTMNLHLFS